MKLDPSMHIGLHLVFFRKSGVASRVRYGVPCATSLGGSCHNVGVDGLFRTPLPSGQGGGVLCWVRLFVFRVRSCGGVCFGVLCTNASF
jgi:hypothetical protein